MKKLMMAAIAACAAMAQAATTGDYVQEGLVACWDGWENDGAGGHATTLTEWKDTGGAHPFVFNASAAIEVRPLGLYFPGANADYATLSKDNTPNTFDLCTNGVLEVCIIAEKDATSFLLQSTPTAGIAFGATSISSGNRQLLAGTKATRKYNYDWTAGFGTFSLTYQFGLNTSLHHNGAAVDSSAVGAIGSSTTTAFLGINSNKSSGWAFKGMVYSIRLYDAPLTAEQRALNMVVDEMRFAKGDVYPLTGVYVRGEPQNYGTAATLGYGFAAKEAGDEIELTAPEYVEISATERAYCTGWKLYDRATGDLISESTDATRLSFAQAYKKPVRLDWQWDVRHPVTVSAAEGLTVTPASAWGSAATPAEFTVEGAEFPLWSDGGLGGDVHAKTVSFAPTAATAVAVSAATVRKPADVTGLVTAIASSGDGDVVVVPDGLSFAEVTAEQMAGDLAITKAVLVTSASGDPKDVTVDLGGTGHGFTLNAAGARLKGVTFTSSATVTDSADLNLPRFVNVITGALDGCVFADIALGVTKSKGAHVVSLAPNGIIENCLFKDLSTAADSLTKGAVYATGGLIRKSVFRSCATRPSPVVASGETTLEVEDCSFTGINTPSGNKAASYGAVSGGNYRYSTPTVIMRRTVVANNTVAMAGVSYFSTENTTTKQHFEDCILTNNVAGGDSGVFGFNGRPCYVVDRCLIADNVGNKYGLISGVTYGTETFRNCLIRGNTGKSVAGVTSATGDSVKFQFENCTVIGNKTTTGSYHGINIAGCGTTANTWVKNCIVYGNGSSDDMQLGVDADKVFNSCYPEAGENANGNISADPQLNEDGTLKYTSPCLDAGNILTVTAGALDFVGTVRPQNATGAAVALWDMGCYEMPPNNEPLVAAVTIDQEVGASPATVTATASVSGTKTEGLTFDWMIVRTAPDAWTNTVPGSAEASCSFGILATGAYEVYVTVKNDAGDSVSVKCEQGFSSKPGTCYVSKTGSDEWPYDTLAKATTNLSAAIANAAEKVVIVAGNYAADELGPRATDSGTGASYLAVVDSPVAVVGEGEGRTVIDLANQAGFALNSTGASLGGLAVTNAGSSVSTEGVALRIVSGVVSNVVVKGGTVFGAVAFVGPGGVLRNSRITEVSQYPKKDDNQPVMLCCGLLEDVLIDNNACGNCGGVRVLSPTVSTHARLNRVRVLNNTVANGTGALLGSYAVDVTDCDFIGNDSTSGNGGAVISAPYGAPNSPKLTMANCRVISNRVHNCSGVITVSGGASSLDNILIAANVGAASVKTPACYGLYLSENCTYTLKNCTVTDNETAHSVNGGARIESKAANAKTIVNCLFWGNHGTNGVGSADFVITGEGSTVRNCCWPEATRENGNTPDDPKLRKVKRYRYYPSPTGSCYETGDPTGWTADDVDLAGNPRKRGEKVDIGCYQILPLPGFMLMLK